MSGISGKHAVLRGNAGSGWVVLSTKDITTPDSVDALDSTSHSASGVKRQTPGLTGGGEVTFSGNWDATTHDFLTENKGVSIDWEYYGQGMGTGKPKVSFDGFVSRYEQTAPVADILGYSGAVAVDGEFTYGVGA